MQKKIGVIFGIAAVVLVSGWLLFKEDLSSQSKVTLKEVEVRVDIADTEGLRSQGLSGRKSLADDEGMLFVFDAPGIYSFWMKDMHFPIDIIWIDADKQVVQTTQHASPESYPNTFFPQVPVQYVLEVPSGFVQEHSVGIGNMLMGLDE